MQLDVDEDDEPFFKPAVVQTEPLIPKSKREAQQQQQPDKGGPQTTVAPRDGASHAEVEAAATATVEQEE